MSHHFENGPKTRGEKSDPKRIAGIDCEDGLDWRIESDWVFSVKECFSWSGLIDRMVLWPAVSHERCRQILQNVGQGLGRRRPGHFDDYWLSMIPAAYSLRFASIYTSCSNQIVDDQRQWLDHSPVSWLLVSRVLFLILVDRYYLC